MVVTHVGKHFSNGEWGGVYGVLSIVWGVGALIGLMIGRVTMELNTHSLPLMAALFCGLFMLFTKKEYVLGRLSYLTNKSDEQRGIKHGSIGHDFTGD